MLAMSLALVSAGVFDAHPWEQYLHGENESLRRKRLFR
jgi:hypothetical protein